MQIRFNGGHMKTLGERITFYRKQHKLTQKKLGKIVGLDQTVISKLERGDMQESAKIAQLARALMVDAYWLATGEGPEQLNKTTQTALIYEARDPILDDLDVLDPDDAAMFKNRLDGIKIDIKRAAKAARKLHEESDRRGASGTGDPPLERRRAT